MGVPSFQKEGVEPWKIELLGTFNVSRLGFKPRFRTRKTAGVLAYLAYYCGKPISKELLAECFWPDANADQSRHSLRMALYDIRSALTVADIPIDSLLVTSRNTCEILPEFVEVDVLKFRKHLDEAQTSKSDHERACFLQSAIEIYQGPLLSGFTESWVLPQMLELEESYAQAVSRLSDLLSQRGDGEVAAKMLKRAMALCSFREDLHIALIRTYVQAGKTSAAIQQYEVLEKMLDEEWGELPSSEATELLESLPKKYGDTLAPLEEKIVTPVFHSIERERTELEQSVFYGRQKELEELTSLLQPGGDSRLVTLVGIGGSGKTRLAQKALSNLISAYENRAWLIPLVSVRVAKHLPDIILMTLHKSSRSGQEPFEEVMNLLGEKPALLVLDNLEQLLPVCAQTVHALLERCKGLSILVTSRIPTGISGERILTVRSLELPKDWRDLNELRTNPCVMLLLHSAQSVRPGFDVTAANARSVYEICVRLEGIPLAIELAAMKLATKSPAQVLGSIGRRVDLSTTSLDFPERHRSLREVIRWSYELLEDEDRIAFTKLSLCDDGFESDLAEALLGDRAEERIRNLLQFGLVNWVETEEYLRFSILETVRELVYERLLEDESIKRDAEKKHFDFFLNLCTNAKKEDINSWVSRIDREQANILVALAVAQSAEIDAEEAWRFAFGLQEYIWRRGRFRIWVEPLEHLLEATHNRLSSETATTAHSLIGKVHYGLRDIEASYQHYRISAEMAETTKNIPLIVQARTDLCVPSILLGLFEEGKKSLKQTLTLLDTSKDARLCSVCELNLGWLTYYSGDEGGSEDYFRKALESAERSDEDSAKAEALVGIACAISKEKYEEARSHFEKALEIFEKRGYPERIAHCSYQRALTEYRNSNFEGALFYLYKSLRVFTENGVRLGQHPLTVAGIVLSGKDLFEEAVACWKRAEATRERYGLIMMPVIQEDYEREFARALDSLNEEQIHNAESFGTRASDEKLVDFLFRKEKIPSPVSAKDVL
ncbi:MAG TPA: BTAD domain-containing putative transcriptional regulator [Fimbriimonadales bacterium]|nr:BTAD domain-containing putative transcriptional regulator [Fimbriimonadales bacterium]